MPHLFSHGDTEGKTFTNINKHKKKVVLSGYTTKQRAAHSAVTRVLSTSPNTHSQTLSGTTQM